MTPDLTARNALRLAFKVGEMGISIQNPNQGPGQNPNQGPGQNASVPDEVNTAWLLVPVLGGLLLYSWRRRSKAKA